MAVGGQGRKGLAQTQIFVGCEKDGRLCPQISSLKEGPLKGVQIHQSPNPGM